MAEEEEKECCHVEIEKADNGWIVEYRVPTKSKGTFDNMSSTKHEKVFKTDEEDQAFDLFRKLKKAEKPMY